VGIDSTLSAIERRSEKGPPRAPALLLLLECSRPWAGSARYLLEPITEVALGRGAERSATREGDRLRITLPDRWMSSRHARIEHRFGRWVLSDEGSKNGTAVNGRAVTSAVLADGDRIEVGHSILRFRARLEIAETDRWSAPAAVIDTTAASGPAGMATLVPELARDFDQARRLAAAGDIPLLIQGESGTGKELLARAVHQLTGRRGDMVAVNCGAIPANLVESELFGHVRGAFSGAVGERAGLIRSADGGTLFLDEIGDLALPSQAALLRVLQEREVMAVGATRPVPVDIRVVSATHRDLEAMVQSGEFRRDLYARLSGYALRLPPLRERLDDLGVIVASLFSRLVPRPEEHPGLSIECARALLAHEWPLNIRELESALRAGLALAGERTIELEHLPATVGARPAAPAADDPDAELRASLEAKLREHRGNISAVARDIGKDRKQIQRWLKRFDLDAERFR
jgi:transcriptional regulator of acetoin/glycerol metabolism